MIGVELMRAEVLCTLIVLLTIPPVDGQIELLGIVTHQEGTVVVRRPERGAPSLPLYPRDSLFIGDQISTADRSLASLLFGRMANITLRERSSIAINETSAIILESGKIRLVSDGVPFAIHTPNAIGSVVPAAESVLIVHVADLGDGKVLYTTKLDWSVSVIAPDGNSEDSRFYPSRKPRDAASGVFVRHAERSTALAENGLEAISVRRP
jgi:hypothetical protein